MYIFVREGGGGVLYSSLWFGPGVFISVHSIFSLYDMVSKKAAVLHTLHILYSEKENGVEGFRSGGEG